MITCPDSNDGGPYDGHEDIKVSLESVDLLEVAKKEVKKMTDINKPKCPTCGSGFVYTLQDGTIVCRLCGARSKPKGEGKR